MKRFSESPEDMMPASPDEKSMAMRQAKFIEYVAEEIEEYLEQNRAFPEWMQNKLTALHQKAKDMHAVMAGDYEDEEDDEDMNESKKLDELSPNLLHRYVKKASIDLVGRSAGASAGDKKSQKKVGQRLTGISGASGRMADKANQNESYINEKLSVSDGMAAWISDFKKSDAPQFKGKDEKERRDMAIAAYLDAKRGAKNEKFVSAAQRKAVWATKADGGKGHPDNKGKKK